jgi:hypothetical protein
VVKWWVDGSSSNVAFRFQYGTCAMDLCSSIKIIHLDRAVGDLSIQDHEEEVPFRREASVSETGTGNLSHLYLSFGLQFPFILDCLVEGEFLRFGFEPDLATSLVGSQKCKPLLCFLNSMAGNPFFSHLWTHIDPFVPVSTDTRYIIATHFLDRMFAMARLYQTS